jgi:hypothetical protein
VTPKKISEKSSSKLCQENHNKELRKSPQRRTGKAPLNLEEPRPSIHTMKVHTMSIFPPIHPSLSLDLT